jgi:hypothetical protein
MSEEEEDYLHYLLGNENEKNTRSRWALATTKSSYVKFKQKSLIK